MYEESYVYEIPTQVLYKFNKKKGLKGTYEVNKDDISLDNVKRHLQETSDKESKSMELEIIGYDGALDYLHFENGK